jgi:hypothetical protein
MSQTLTKLTELTELRTTEQRETKVPFDAFDHQIAGFSL